MFTITSSTCPLASPHAPTTNLACAQADRAADEQIAMLMQENAQLLIANAHLRERLAIAEAE